MFASLRFDKHLSRPPQDGPPRFCRPESLVVALRFHVNGSEPWISLGQLAQQLAKNHKEQDGASDAPPGWDGVPDDHRQHKRERKERWFAAEQQMRPVRTLMKGRTVHLRNVHPLLLDQRARHSGDKAHQGARSQGNSTHKQRSHASLCERSHVVMMPDQLTAVPTIAISESP